MGQHSGPDFPVMRMGIMNNVNARLVKRECVVPENIHTPPTEGHWKFRGGGGFKGRNFQGDWGVHRKLIFQRVKKHEKIESNARLMPSTK